MTAAMGQLEKDKARMDPPLDRASDQYHCENFAINIFRCAPCTQKARDALDQSIVCCQC